MKKNIIIVLLALITVFFVVLSNIKAEEADKYKTMAEANLKLAKQSEQKALEQEELATMKAAEARVEARRAEEAVRKAEKALLECQGK
ncbi:hypothetical protein [Reichenbachiella ulvae]|uniref:Colicin import membrane protein n=1 Tax=Reichenbachiella ulvae TaxID=2980104 RepID=A0ABT3CUB7_9BACT|nr:hypothetical protein [Reichenbachiella ulvae]MCV9387114.1 hypothetical protein [Reichenbachiella ulvae]